MRRMLLGIMILCATIGQIFGEGEAETQPVPSTTVRDALGRGIALPAVPSRIVVAGRAVVSIMDALLMFPGAKDRIAGAGVTDQGLGDFYLTVDPSAAGKARFANNAGAEQVAAAKPDLVIMKTYMKDPLGDTLERMGVPVFYVDLESPDAYARDISSLGAVLGRPGRAREIIDWYSSRVEAVRRAATPPAPSVLIIQYMQSGGAISFSVPSAGWIQTRMVEDAGGTPVWASAASSGWSRVGIEQIASWNPDFILVVSYRSPAAEAVKKLAASREWKQLDAVRDGRLLAFPADFYSWDQADTRWILGLQWIAGAIHAGKTDAPDILEAAAEFYSDMYGMTRSDFESVILPKIKR